MNYAVTGYLEEASGALYGAVGAMPNVGNDTPEGHLRDRILRAISKVHSIQQAARKLVPGGFQYVPNAREEDKRAQREALGGA